jgi:hypothetical protein
LYRIKNVSPPSGEGFSINFLGSIGRKVALLSATVVCVSDEDVAAEFFAEGGLLIFG